MNAQDLRELIDSLTDDIEFEYQLRRGSVCPFNRANISLCYDGEEVTVHSVDDAMKTPFVAGYSLEEICDKLEKISPEP